jgi:antitoxin PrlF
MESALTVKGQATIPKAIREHLRLKPGDRVKFFVHPDGSVVLLPKLPAAALRGIIRRGGRRVTLAQMTRAAAEGAADSDRSIRRGGGDAGKMPAVRNGARRRAGGRRGSRPGLRQHTQHG